MGEVTVSYSCVENGGYDESSPGETNRDDCDSTPFAGIDRGNTAALPADWADLDNDGDTTEPMSSDGGGPRVRGAAVDIGAAEME